MNRARHAKLRQLKFSYWTASSELGARLNPLSLPWSSISSVSTRAGSLWVRAHASPNSICPLRSVNAHHRLPFVKNLRDLATAVLAELCLHGVHCSTGWTVGRV